MAEAAFSTWVEVTIAATTMFGIAANGVAAYDIWRTFPHRKIAIFFLAVMDSMVCFAGNALYLVSFALAGHYRNFQVCIFENMFRLFQIYSGVLITLQIGATRFISVSLSQRWKSVSERQAFRINLLVYLLHCAVFLHRLIWQPLSEGPPFNTVIHLCLGFTGPRVDFDWRLAFAFIWLAILPLISMLVNFLTMVVAKTKVFPTGATKKKPTYMIPLQATLLSAALFSLIAFGIACLRFLDMSMGNSNAISMIIGVGINALRCPLAMSLTFSHKVRADLQNREKRRELVRNWARQERNKRNADVPMNFIHQA